MFLAKSFPFLKKWNRDIFRPTNPAVNLPQELCSFYYNFLRPDYSLRLPYSLFSEELLPIRSTMLNIKTMLLPVLLFSVQGFAAIVQQSPSPSPRAESSSSGFLPPTGTDLESVADSAQLVLAAPSLSGPRVGWVRVSRSCFQALQEALARTNGEDATWESLHWELDVVGYSPGTAELKMPDGRETLHRAWSLARHGEWRVMEDPEYIRRVLEQDQHYGNGGKEPEFVFFTATTSTIPFPTQ